MKINRIVFILGFIITLFGCAESEIQIANEEVAEPEEENEAQEQDPVHPNILLIIADDMSLDAVPNYADELGAKKPIMPTLEKLMNTGLVFDNLWSYALCSPTRASILTGKHGLHTDVLEPIRDMLSGDHISLQSYINNNTGDAYATGVFGKWHLGADATHPTKTMDVGTYSGSIGGGVPDYWSYKLVENEVSRSLTSSNDMERAENYSTTKYTQLAMDWKQQQTKPWFIWLAYNAAHTPFHRPDDRLISSESIARSESNTNNYLAMLEAMDFEMGRFIDAMTEAEKANTLIVFIGDNGTPKKVAQFTDIDKHSKGSIYQGGINVPLVVAGLNVRVGRESDVLVHTVDLYATIAEFAGVDSKSIYNSFSFKDVLEDVNAQGKEFIYTEVPKEESNGFFAVRNSSYKLIFEIDTGAKELYNLKDDKYESNDLTLGVMSETDVVNLALLMAEGERLRAEE